MIASEEVWVHEVNIFKLKLDDENSRRIEEEVEWDVFWKQDQTICNITINNRRKKPFPSRHYIDNAIVHSRQIQRNQTVKQSTSTRVMAI